MFGPSEDENRWRLWNEVSSGKENYHFGEQFSLSSNGSILVVGVPQENIYSGSMYIYNRPFGGTEWFLEAEISLPVGYKFGSNVLVSGDGMRLVVSDEEDGVSLRLYERRLVSSGPSTHTFEWFVVSHFQDKDYLPIQSLKGTGDLSTLLIGTGNGSVLSCLLSSDTYSCPPSHSLTGAEDDSWNSFAISSDGLTAAYSNSSSSNIVKIKERLAVDLSWDLLNTTIIENPTFRSNRIFEFGNFLSLNITGNKLLISTWRTVSSSQRIQKRREALVYTREMRTGASWSQEGEGGFRSVQSTVEPFYSHKYPVVMSADGSMIAHRLIDNNSQKKTVETVERCPYAMECSPSALPIDCPMSYYCPDYRGIKISCPAGNYCPGSVGSPIVCEVSGDYCPFFSSRPADCPSGYYCPTPALAQACEQGNYCPSRSTSMIPCDLGYRCPATASAQIPCPLGYYCEDAGSERECPSQHYCPEGTVEPIPCPLGTVSDTGASVCDEISCGEDGFPFRYSNGGTDCEYIYIFGAPHNVLVAQGGVALVSVLFLLVLLPTHDKVWFFNLLIMSFNVFAWTADTWYVISEPFKSSFLQWLAMGFLLAPLIPFLLEIRPWPHMGFVITGSTYFPYYPLHNKQIFEDVAIDPRNDPLDLIALKKLFKRVINGIVRSIFLALNTVLFSVYFSFVIATALLLFICHYVGWISGLVSIEFLRKLFHNAWSLKFVGIENGKLENRFLTYAMSSRAIFQALPLFFIRLFNQYETSRSSDVYLIHIITSSTFTLFFTMQFLCCLPCKGFDKFRIIFT